MTNWNNKHANYGFFNITFVTSSWFLVLHFVSLVSILWVTARIVFRCVFLYLKKSYYTVFGSILTYHNFYIKGSLIKHISTLLCLLENWRRSIDQLSHTFYCWLTPKGLYIYYVILILGFLEGPTTPPLKM